MDYRAKHGMYDDSWGHQNKEELLIFGYSCKLFRDDDKALSLDKEDHLIPWMGDNNLMIDRFDVRGALYDLKEAESKGTSSEPMSEVELKEEELCEQERYLALYHDETQEQWASEEEAKRLQVELAAAAADESYYNQVGFAYTSGSYATESTESIPYEVPEEQIQIVAEPVTYNPSVDDDVYIPPAEMNVPPEMEVPKTVKQNKIIIKTAKFIVSQGAQMEIVIKTKQAGNPMFNFLAFDHPLNSYYKYVVGLFRHGKYKWEDDSDAQNALDGNSQYLHPNLSQSVRPDLTPGVISSPSRPSPHCAYTKLITKIREKQIATKVEDAEIASPIAPSSPAPTVNATPKEKKPVSSARTSTEPVVSLVDYPSFNQTADGSDIEDMEPVFVKKIIKVSVHDYSKIKWPPREIQMVIDKMACYIIKNGSAFEEVVRSRDDPRFEFLNKTHEYHPYYNCKIELYGEVYGDTFKNSNKTQDWKKKSQSNASKKGLDHSAKNGGSRTISFSIKSREQEVSLTSHTTFPIESSTSEEDDDMSDDEREKKKQEREQRRQARKIKEEKEKKEREEFLKKEKLRKEKEEEEKRKERERLAEDDSSGNEDLYDIFKYAQEMQRDTKPKLKIPVKPEPDEPVLKQEERKKKAAAFLSKLRDSKDDKTPVIYGPQLPPDIAAGLLQSASQSPASSRESSEREKPPPPPPLSENKPPLPPPPRSPSPPGLTDVLRSFESDKVASSSREISVSPKRNKAVDSSNSMASVLLSGLTEHLAKQLNSEPALQNEEVESRKSRSHKKHSRHKSRSYSPSSKRERKKRKRSRGSSHRRKKHRSRSRSRSRGYSKSQRSYHKKKQSKHSSHRDKEKTRKKKHRRHRSPSSVSSLPSSESSSHSSPTTLPSESESDMDIQVIESDERKSSRSSSVVSLPSVSNFSRTNSKKLSSETILEENKISPKTEGFTSGGEENSTSSLITSTSVQKPLRPLFPPLESSNSSEGGGVVEGEKKSLFDPNASLAMAKIAQGLRAKINALLENENKLE